MDAVKAAGDVGEGLGGLEDAQSAVDDVPAGPDEVLVLHLHELRVVVARQRALLARGPRQAAKLGIRDGALAGLLERRAHAVQRDVRRLRPEPYALAVRPFEYDLYADAVVLDRLGLLDAVAGGVRGGVEPRQQDAVGR